MEVELAERGQEPVGVGDGVRRSPPFVAHLQAVVDEVGERHGDREQARIDVGEHIALVADHRRDLDGMGPIGPDDRVIAVLVRTQDRMRVVVFARDAAGSDPPDPAASSGWSVDWSVSCFYVTSLIPC